MNYLVAKPTEYIAVTGWGIDDVEIVKTVWVTPLQRARPFDISPVTYSFDLNAMSEEKLQFNLPVVFTIGPLDEPESLKRYAKLVGTFGDTHASDPQRHMQDIVMGIVEGEARTLVASMSVDELIRGRDQFRKGIVDKVEGDLKEFGLHVYNANIRELVDVEGQEYFCNLGRKFQQEVANQARIDVAEATYRGDMGEREKQGMTLRNAATVDAQTRVFTKTQNANSKQEEIRVDSRNSIFEIQRGAEVATAESDLAVKRAELTKLTEIARIESHKAAQIREAELDGTLERQRAEATTARLRGQDLARAAVKYEVAVQKTNGATFELNAAADTDLYQRQQAAEAAMADADAALYRLKKEADGHLYEKQKDAEGTRLMATSQRDYVESMLLSFNGDKERFRNFMLMDTGVYQDLGHANVEALQDLEASLCSWTSTRSTTTGPFY